MTLDNASTHDRYIPSDVFGGHAVKLAINAAEAADITFTLHLNS
jgi:hypothetical protein